MIPTVHDIIAVLNYEYGKEPEFVETAIWPCLSGGVGVLKPSTFGVHLQESGLESGGRPEVAFRILPMPEG